MPVSVREFKAHLSRYLAQVRAGDTVEISLHRKVVARLSGVPEQSPQGVQRLVSSGAAQWAGGKPRGAEIRLAEEGHPVSSIVMEDRG